MRTGRLDAGLDEESLAAKRGAGDEAAGVAHGELGDIDGVEAIDVLAGIDGGDDGSLIDMIGRWGLDEDAVDGGVCIELANKPDELLLLRLGGHLVFHRVKAEFQAFACLRADVCAGGGVIADEDDGEAGGDALGLERLHGRLGLGVDFFGNGFSVYQGHGEVVNAVLYKRWADGYGDFFRIWRGVTHLLFVAWGRLHEGLDALALGLGFGIGGDEDDLIEGDVDSGEWEWDHEAVPAFQAKGARVLDVDGEDACAGLLGEVDDALA